MIKQNWRFDLMHQFDETEIEWRCQKAGIKNERTWAQVVPYITSRAIYSRLDDVIGPDLWQTTYRETNVGGEDGFICGIGICIEGTWIWKHNGAGCGDQSPIKAGCSNSFKRAAVEWGIGRYLYNMTAEFVDVQSGYAPKDGGNYIDIYQKAKDGRPEIKGWAHAPGADSKPGPIPGMQDQGPPDVPPHDDGDAPGSSGDGFPAQYDTWCTVCGEKHEKGTQIAKYGKNSKGNQGYAAIYCLQNQTGEQ